MHKRLLLNPDEIGRFLARIDDRHSAAYPGIVLTLIPGEQPLAVHRVNYFESSKFDAFFDPHPDHPAPPTIAERIRLIADRSKREQEAVRPRRYRLACAGAAAAAILIISIATWFVMPTGPAAKPTPDYSKFQPHFEPSAPKVASLPPSAPPQIQPTPIDPHETAQQLQSELQRVGCYSGAIDGEWTSQSIEAMREFNRHAHTNLAPVPESVPVIRSHDGRVCPLICPQGQKAEGERCITLVKAPAPPSRPAPRPMTAAPRPVISGEHSQGTRCVTALGTTFCE